jgi:hypothetical protein
MALKFWRKQKLEPTLPAVMPLLKKMEGLLIETETDTTVIKKMEEAKVSVFLSEFQ